MARDLLCLLAVVFAAHLGTLFGMFALDDFDVLFGLFSDPASDWTARQVRSWSLAFDGYFWTAGGVPIPFGYHLSNLLLHGANAVAVLCMARALVGLREAGLWAGLLWAVHPVGCESVANVANRKEGFLVFFSVVCVLAFLRGGWRRWAVAFPAFLLALSAKETAVALPFLLLVCDRSRKGSWSAVRLGDHLAFLGVVALAGWLLFLKGSGADPGTRPVHISLLGKSGLELLAVSGEAFWISLGFLALPVGLSADPAAVAGGPWGLIGIGAAAALGFAALRRMGTGWRPSAAWLWVVLAWLPVASIVTPSAFPLADRYWSLPAVGAAVLLGGFLARPWGVPTSKPFLCGVAVAACWVALSAVQDRAWSDDRALGRSTLVVNPRSVHAHLSRANLLGYGRKLPAAARQFEIACEIQPRSAACVYFWGRWEALAGGRIGPGREKLARAWLLGYRSVQFFVDCTDASARAGDAISARAWLAAARSAGKDGPEFRRRLGELEPAWDADGVKNEAREAVRAWLKQ